MKRIFSVVLILITHQTLCQAVEWCSVNETIGRFVVQYAGSGNISVGDAFRLVAEEEEEPKHVVSQKEKVFTPAKVEIKLGETVTILNDDEVIHNAYCRAKDFKYNSGPQKPGSKSVVEFTKAGKYQIRCAIHPKMLLEVTVTE